MRLRLERLAHFLARPGFLLFLLMLGLIFTFTLMSFFEVWYVGVLIGSFQDPFRFFFLFASALILLFLLNLTLSLLCLELTEAARAAGLAETVVLMTLIISYALIPKQKLIQPLVFLACGKLLSTILFARFWHAKFRVFRMTYRESPTARFFLSDRRRFFSCRWVLLGNWFLSILAFALALVVHQPSLELQGWEGISLMLTFFALFWIFVRNPFAHSES